MNILAGILSFFTGGGFKGIAEELNEAYQATLKAKNDNARLQAEQKMHLITARVAAQAEGAGAIWAKVMRAGFGVPPMLYNAKLYVYDKMLGLGTTDALSPYLEGVAWTIIGFYFLDNTLRMVRR